jgi:hypothetical protein
LIKIAKNLKKDKIQTKLIKRNLRFKINQKRLLFYQKNYKNSKNKKVRK